MAAGARSTAAGRGIVVMAMAVEEADCVVAEGIVVAVVMMMATAGCCPCRRRRCCSCCDWIVVDVLHREPRLLRKANLCVCDVMCDVR